MLKAIDQTRKLSCFFLFLLTLCLTLLLWVPWISAKEPPNPKLHPWQIDGLVAALDDSYPSVKELALNKLAEYEPQDLKSVGQKLDDIAQKAVNILKDKTVDSRVRNSAAKALGNLGEVAQPYLKDYVKDIVDILRNKTVDSRVREQAAFRLTSLGKVAQPYVKDIVDILKDKTVDSRVRNSMAVALGNLGEAAQPYVKDIADIVRDKTVDSGVRHEAALALANLGMDTTPYVKDILDLLKEDKDSEGRRGIWKFLDALCIAKPNTNVFRVQARVFETQRNLREAAQPYIKDIVNILKDKTADSLVRGYAACAFGKQGKANQPYVKDIVDILKDKTVDQDVRVRNSAAEALGNLGEAAQPYVKDIVDILKDKTVDQDVRNSASVALGNLGEAAQPYVKDIVDILKDKTVDQDVRNSASVALGNLGEAAQPYVKDILNILNTLDYPNSSESSYENVFEALGNIQQLNLDEAVLVLNTLYSLDIEKARFFTYFLSGGTDEVKTLLKWLPDDRNVTIPTQLTRAEGVKILNVFLKVWKPDSLEQLRVALERPISVVATQKNVLWQQEDIGLLESHYRNLKQVNSIYADTVQSVLNNLKAWKLFFGTLNLLLTHFAFWLICTICSRNLLKKFFNACQ